MPNLWRRSQWFRVSMAGLLMTFLFMVFYAAIPSLLMGWTDEWAIVENNSQGAAWGPRIRDAAVMGYHGGVIVATFVAFSLWQRLHPVNADPDESKREGGGYR